MANANEPPVHPSPPRPGGRHQIKRSLTELTGPVKLKSGHHARHSVQHNHPPHRRDRYNDDKELQTAHPGTTRRSLDMPRSDALSHSRRPSAMGLRDEDVSRVNSNQLSIKANKDDKLRKELDRTDSRVE